MGWGQIFNIFNKLFPSRKENYADKLNKLLVKYDKALAENRDTDAAIIRKRMIVLRKKLGFSGGNL